MCQWREDGVQKGAVIAEPSPNSVAVTTSLGLCQSHVCVSCTCFVWTLFSSKLSPCIFLGFCLVLQRGV